MNRLQDPVLALTGPTASGKTALSLVLARRLQGEVISMDSRQVYRGMDIGTAKVTPEERGGVPHHGLDLIDPDQGYSAGRFARDARGWVREIRERARLPMLVGGTGFFLRALIDPVFREPPMDRVRRSRLRAWLSARPSQELARWVRALDPERAALAEEGGQQRLSRTLELPLLTGRSLSWWHAHAPDDADPVPARVAVVVLPREILYDRINLRAWAMFQGGLLDEVEELLRRGFGPDAPGMTGTGYREAIRVLEGDLRVEAAVEETARLTRGYARRQLTWIRNQLPPDHLQVEGLAPVEDQAHQVLGWWLGTEVGDGG